MYSEFKKKYRKCLWCNGDDITRMLFVTGENSNAVCVIFNSVSNTHRQAQIS